ncbi:MAG: hypothetical protein LH650_04800 [Chloroflexi bacterium]|nr:hypothetical protein [Chloroflexota bacterium]
MAIAAGGLSAAASSPVPVAAGSTAPYRSILGWIVLEHFGQAPDGSTTSMDFDRHEIWLVHADGTGLHELAPGKPIDGKSSPDISPDGTKVVFSSWSPTTQVWEVGIEGGDPRLVSTDCSSLETDC